MRKILIIFASVALLASCSKDPNKVTNEALEGTWNLTSYTTNGEEWYGPDLLIYNGSETFTMSDDFTGKVSSTVTFFPGDPDNEETASASSTYEISGEGSTITMTDSEDGEKTVATITLEDDTYKMSYTDGDGNAVVVKAKKK